MMSMIVRTHTEAKEAQREVECVTLGRHLEPRLLLIGVEVTVLNSHIAEGEASFTYYVVGR
jgi:hypothetical protein